MKLLIVGLGIQGRKRMAVSGTDVVATVDPLVPSAQYKMVEHVPLDSFEAALVCTPDQTKPGLLRYLLSHGKHVLVEKPLVAPEAEPLLELARLARLSGVACYTAYNHRFEPHIARLKTIVDAGTIGTVYLVRCFYGNGTATDVRHSPWRDQGMGVLPDLGSHLLDLMLFLFGEPEGRFEPWSFNRFENRTYDHVLFGSTGKPIFALEGTLVSWRNTFTLDVFGERGSAHIQGLCKWGPSTLTVRTRMLPSGRPDERVQTLECPDPTWALEYEHFKHLCQTGGTNLSHDVWISGVLNELERTIGQEVLSS
jgi:predicted dehydrogenase